VEFVEKKKRKNPGCKKIPFADVKNDFKKSSSERKCLIANLDKQKNVNIKITGSANPPLLLSRSTVAFFGTLNFKNKLENSHEQNSLSDQIILNLFFKKDNLKIKTP